MLETRCTCGRLLFKTVEYPVKLELDCHKCHSRVMIENGKITRVLTREELKRLQNNK